MNDYNEEVAHAKQVGWVKFNHQGTEMVVMTQRELDSLLNQHGKDSVDKFCADMSYG